jgi:drug/metabolite transporter (DMT)-like permease
MKAAALCALLSACSYAFVQAPPADDPDDPGDCTESRAAPEVDAVLTGAMALTLLVLVPHCMQTTGYNQDGTPATGCTAGQWAGLAWTGVVGTATTISAVHGFRVTKRCRRRRARLY